MLENLLFLLLGALVGSLVGRAAKRHEQRKERYRILVKLLTVNSLRNIVLMPEVDIDNALWQIGNALSEVMLFGTDSDREQVQTVH